MLCAITQKVRTRLADQEMLLDGTFKIYVLHHKSGYDASYSSSDNEPDGSTVLTTQVEEATNRENDLTINDPQSRQEVHFEAILPIQNHHSLPPEMMVAYYIWI